MKTAATLLLPLFILPVYSQTLVRKALIGLQVSGKSGKLIVDSIYPSSTARFLRLQKADILTGFNDTAVISAQDFYRRAYRVRAGETVVFSVTRGKKRLHLSGVASARPLETSPVADITYDWVPFQDGFLRTVVHRPRTQGKVPAILFIPGYGCGSIENFTKSYNGPLIDAWVQAGYAVITIEKSGMGDSYSSLPCQEVDLATDIQSFTAGYRYMEGLDFVDSRQLYIWGHSLGGMIAPEIAKSRNVRGVMVFGTVFRPWSEFLPEMHRVQKPLLENKNYLETERFARLIQKVYYEFFILKKTREELYAVPEYSAIVASELEYTPGGTNMWGRHWRFWQQIDSLNLAESWSSVSCPVLVINGGSDYEQCAAIEPLLIERTVNASHPGNATRIQIEDLDHFMMKSQGYEQAVENFRNRDYTRGNFNVRIASETINWLNKQSGKS